MVSDVPGGRWNIKLKIPPLHPLIYDIFGVDSEFSEAHVAKDPTCRVMGYGSELRVEGGERAIKKRDRENERARTSKRESKQV